MSAIGIYFSHSKLTVFSQDSLVKIGFFAIFLKNDLSTKTGIRIYPRPPTNQQLGRPFSHGRIQRSSDPFSPNPVCKSEFKGTLNVQQMRMGDDWPDGGLFVSRMLFARLRLQCQQVQLQPGGMSLCDSAIWRSAGGNSIHAFGVADLHRRRWLNGLRSRHDDDRGIATRRDARSTDLLRRRTDQQPATVLIVGRSPIIMLLVADANRIPSARGSYRGMRAVFRLVG
jgi:hypothetical protein